MSTKASKIWNYAIRRVLSLQFLHIPKNITNKHVQGRAPWEITTSRVKTATLVFGFFSSAASCVSWLQINTNTERRLAAEGRNWTGSFFSWWIMKGARRRPPQLRSKFSSGKTGRLLPTADPRKSLLVGWPGIHIPLFDSSPSSHPLNPAV